MAIPTLLRKLHYWGSIIIAVPIAVVIATGLLLQLKKDVDWIQPKENATKARVVAVPPERILEAARQAAPLRVSSWDEIARVDIRPDKGLVKITAVNRFELQLNAETGEPLQTAYRRSDLIESIHDGSWFHDNVKLWLFLPSGFILFGLWLTGIYLFALPYWVRGQRRLKTPARQA